jgi:hypothetical protein
MGRWLDFTRRTWRNGRGRRRHGLISGRVPQTRQTSGFEREDDAALGNKDASLAEAGKSSEAIQAYGEAFNIKPELPPRLWVVGQSLRVEGRDKRRASIFEPK